MRFIVLGTSEFTLSCTSAFLHCGAELVALISMPHNVLPNNSANVETFAEANDIPYYKMEDINQPESISLLRELGADYIFSSWPRIIGAEVLQIPRYFTIGTHPTDLPRNRGRHPLHWLIALGISESKLSFFRMDGSTDTGAILHQEAFSIEDNDDISTVVARVNDIAYRGTVSLYKLLLLDPCAPGTIQDERLANYWRKRTPHDSFIDPRLTVNTVIRAVHSLAPPYPAACLIVNDHILKIRAAARVVLPSQSADINKMEPGKVLAADTHNITFKVDDGVVKLTSLDPIPETAQRVKYIHPPTKYLCSYPELVNRL